VDAVKIARIYLSALSPIVWQPDAKTDLSSKTRTGLFVV
jgi:hypothetical protein